MLKLTSQALEALCLCSSQHFRSATADGNVDVDVDFAVVMPAGPYLRKLTPPA
jgi:hypothetical protein